MELPGIALPPSATLPTSVKRLDTYLHSVEHGPVVDTTELESLLALCWDQLQGDDGGMSGAKICGRIEGVHWMPPGLRFSIQRHDMTARGSTGTQVQGWVVDVPHGVARCSTGRSYHRFVPRGPVVAIQPLAAELAELVAADEADDPRIQRHADGRVRLVMAAVFPEGSAPRKTVAGRRQRLVEALTAQLHARGYIEVQHRVWGAVRDGGALC